MRYPLRPLNPMLHADYVEAIDHRDSLPSGVRAAVVALIGRRSTAQEQELDAIDREIVAHMSWYAVRPDDIARRTLRYRGWSPRHHLTIDQATVIMAAIGEAGYPIAGNGAPDYADAWQMDYPPVRGAERDTVVWAAARYWATAASRYLTYVSLGDHRGYMPRAVQYDQPGSMHPGQKAALTLGPAMDRGDECSSHAYMRHHTRLLLLVHAKREAPGVCV